MNLLLHIKEAFQTTIKNLFNNNSEILTSHLFLLNVDSQKQDFGDLTSNAALIVAKELKMQPRAIAEHLKAAFNHPYVLKTEVAGPGFINLWLTKEAYVILAETLFNETDQFFKLDQSAQRKTYNIEFVSANPTGPLHLGHGRGGIIGDVLGNVLRFLGHSVTKEFYINDAGAQIKKLGASFKARYQQELGLSAELPEDGYHGEYLKDLAACCIRTNGNAFLEKPDLFFENYTKDMLLEKIKETLLSYGINFDVWFSEKKLHESDAITASIAKLAQHEATYEKDGALWFKSIQYGDDKDRVVRRANGELTYAAADIAYLENKINRGFNKLIMILGQDHHSYKQRLAGILQALGHPPSILEVILYQLVTLKEGGEALRMSKRKGRIVTLEDVIDTIGKDVARFFYLNRKADAHLDFDLELALKKSDENPVYYIQYAYVRTGSILEKSKMIEGHADINAHDAQEIGNAEYILLKKIISLKTILESISTTYQTHTLTYFVLELAQLFHKYYAENRVIDPENHRQSRARLAVITVLRATLGICLDLLGISKPEKM